MSIPTHFVFSRTKVNFTLFVLSVCSKTNYPLDPSLLNVMGKWLGCWKNLRFPLLLYQLLHYTGSLLWLMRWLIFAHVIVYTFVVRWRQQNQRRNYHYRHQNPNHDSPRPSVRCSSSNRRRLLAQQVLGTPCEPFRAWCRQDVTYHHLSMLRLYTWNTAFDKNGETLLEPGGQKYTVITIACKVLYFPSDFVYCLLPFSMEKIN